MNIWELHKATKLAVVDPMLCAVVLATPTPLIPRVLSIVQRTSEKDLKSSLILSSLRDDYGYYVLTDFLKNFSNREIELYFDKYLRHLVATIESMTESPILVEYNGALLALLDFLQTDNLRDIDSVLHCGDFDVSLQSTTAFLPPRSVKITIQYDVRYKEKLISQSQPRVLWFKGLQTTVFYDRFKTFFIRVLNNLFGSRNEFFDACSPTLIQVISNQLLSDGEKLPPSIEYDTEIENLAFTGQEEAMERIFSDLYQELYASDVPEKYYPLLDMEISYYRAILQKSKEQH